MIRWLEHDTLIGWILYFFLGYRMRIKLISSLVKPELITLEWDILNPDRIINLWLKMRGEQAIFNLEIQKKSGLSINPDIHHSKVFSSELKTLEWDILNPDRLINLSWKI